MNISSKLTLYDTLAMLVPGIVILWWFDFFGITAACDAQAWVFIAIIGYAVGLVYHRMVECMVTCTGIRRNPCLMRKQWIKVFGKKIIRGDIKAEYDKDYILITIHGCLLSIPVVEAQEVFLRNSLILIIGSMVKLAVMQVDYCYVVLLFVLLLLCVICWLQSMNKIYFMVWDTFKNIKIFKDEKNNSSKPNVAPNGGGNGAELQPGADGNDQLPHPNV